MPNAFIRLLVGFALFIATPRAFAAEPAKPRVHVVSVAMWGSNSLFRREAIAASDVLSEYFGRRGQNIVIANTLTRSAGRIADVRNTLTGLASSIDRQEDILVLFLTSHGNPDGVAVETFDQRRVFMLSPGRLAGILTATGIRHRIVIISACYSGVFSDLIADDATLVITAADAKHSSFGCNYDNIGSYTYFGEALFGTALKRSRDLDTAFAEARRLVTERELAEGLKPSNPQMAGGAAVREQLKKIE